MSRSIRKLRAVLMSLAQTFIKMPNHIKEAGDSPYLAWSQHPCWACCLRGWGGNLEEWGPGPEIRASSSPAHEVGFCAVRDLLHWSLPPLLPPWCPHPCMDWPRFHGAGGKANVEAPWAGHEISLSGFKSHLHPWLNCGQIPKPLWSSIVQWEQIGIPHLWVVMKI